MSIIWEYHGNSVDYIINYIMDCSMNYTNARKQIKELVVNLARVNKSFNPFNVLLKADR